MGWDGKICDYRISKDFFVGGGGEGHVLGVQIKLLLHWHLVNVTRQ